MESNSDSNEKKGKSSRENSQASGIAAYQPSLDSIFPSQNHLNLNTSIQPTSAIIQESSNHEEGTEPISATFQIDNPSLHTVSPEKNNSHPIIENNQEIRMQNEITNVDDLPSLISESQIALEEIVKHPKNISIPKEASQTRTPNKEKQHPQMKKVKREPVSPRKTKSPSAPSSSTPGRRRLSGRLHPHSNSIKVNDVADEVVNTSLSILCNARQIDVGEELEFMEETGKFGENFLYSLKGYLTRDIWIDCQFTNERYPSIVSWCTAVGLAKKVNKRILRSMNFLDEVQARNHPLRYFVENFVKNQESLSSKQKKVEASQSDASSSSYSDKERIESSESEHEEINKKSLSQKKVLEAPSAPDIELLSSTSVGNSSIELLHNIADADVEQPLSKKQKRAETLEQNEKIHSPPSIVVEKAPSQTIPNLEAESVIVPSPKKTQRVLPSNFLEENLVVKKMETKSPKKISPKKSPKAKKTQIAMEYTGETWLSRRHTQATQEEPAPKPISTTPKKVNNLLEMFRGEAMETEQTTEVTVVNDISMPPPTTPLVFKRRPNSPIQTKLPFNSVSSFNKPENPSPVKTTISKLAADIPKKIVSTQSEDAPILTRKNSVPIANDSELKENRVDSPIKSQDKDIEDNKPGPVILGTGLKSSMLEHLKMTAKKNGGKLINEYSKEVTHVVTIPDKDGTTKRTIKYALGILNKAWIVSYDWILDSFIKEKWVNEQKYEISGDLKALGAPNKSRMNQSCKLFKGMQFYLLGKFTSPSKEELILLIETGEGLLLEDPPKPLQSTQQIIADKTVILCDPLIPTEEARIAYFKTGRNPVDYGFLLDCISFFKILQVDKYRIPLLADNQIFETQNSLGF